MSDKNTTSSDKTVQRYRNFATVLYPESAPQDWKDILMKYAIPGFISPLHDKDVNPTGEPKKPHYHIMLMFEGKKTKDQVSLIFKSFGGVGCEDIKSARGYARYLCHKDNPEKAQYNQEEVISFGGADYQNIIGTAADKIKAINEMKEFCDKYDCSSFYLLSKYAGKNRPDWDKVLIETSAVYMEKWLKSRQWSKENGIDHIVDPESGEILI